MNDTLVLGGDWSPDLRIDGDCSLDLTQDGSASVFMPLKPETYTGPYTFTPSGTAQVIPTAAGALTFVQMRNRTTMSVCVASSSTYGLMPNGTYHYTVRYQE